MKAWGSMLLAKNAVARAVQHMRQLPEMRDIERVCPLGSPGGPPFTPTALLSTRRVQCAGSASRAVDIVSGLPESMGKGMLHATLRRCVSASESTLDYKAGGKFLGAVVKLTRAGEKAGGAQGDFDTSGGHARAGAAEASLAWARLCLFEGGKEGGGGGSTTTQGGLEASLSASGAIEEELRFIEGPGDTAAAVALLPNALAHARTNALVILTRAFNHTGEEGEEKEGGKEGTGITSPFALVLNASSSLEDVLRRTLPPPQPGATPFDPASPARYLHLRASSTLAAAHQNMAVTHLLNSLPFLLGEKGGEMEGGGHALSRFTAAHEHLREALVGLEGVLKGAEVGLASLTPPKEGGGGGDGGDAAASAARKGAWERLVWDLKALKAELGTFHGEVGVLTALGSLWLMGEGNGKGGALFPLSDTERASALPVLKAVHKGANESFREFVAMEGGAPQFCEAGVDGGLGKARALRLLGLLSSLEGVSVTAEGAFRGVLDDYSACLTGGVLLSSPTPTHSGGVGDAGKQWQGLPLPFQAHLASTMHAYGAILQQWDKRQGEAKAFSEGAGALWRNCAVGWGVKSPSVKALLEEDATANPGSSTTSNKRVRFLAQRALGAALTGGAIGSWGLGLTQDLADL